MSPWYLQMGIITLLTVVVYSILKPSDPDWTRMPNPFSPHYQKLIFCMLGLTIFAWPLALIGLAISLVEENK